MTRICLACITLVCFAIVRLSAESADEPLPRGAETPSQKTPEKLTGHLQRDLADGALHDFSLFQAALVVGGVQTAEELRRRTDEFQQRCLPIVAELQTIADPSRKAHRLANQFHETFLSGGYRASFSELPRTLDSGRYNCVTATILFQAVAQQCGFKPQARASAFHVFTSLPGEPTLYIETTCPDWPPSPWDSWPSEMQDRVRESRQLTDVQLLGKVYYNLGVSALEARRFADASESLHMAARLDAWDLAARDNRLATFNNWALAECEVGGYRKATDLVLQGLAIDADYGPLLTNDVYVHKKWVAHLCDLEQFASAIQVLEQAYLRRPDAEMFERGRLVTFGLWASHHFRLGELEAGWQVLHEAQRRCGLAEDPLLERTIVQAAYNDLMARHQLATARQLLEQTLQRYPGEPFPINRKRDLPEAGS